MIGDMGQNPGQRGAGALQCTAVSAGYEQRINEVYSWDGMRRGTAPFLVIQHTTYGEGRLDHAGMSYRLGPGQTMLVTIPHPHRYWLERGGHWEYFWMVLTGREALRLGEAIGQGLGENRVVIIVLGLELPGQFGDAMSGVADTLPFKKFETPGRLIPMSLAASVTLILRGMR